MSEWTYVRIVYDVSLGYGDKHTDVGVMARLESVRGSLVWKEKDNVFSLGSERQMDVHIYPQYGTSMWCGGRKYMRLDDRATVVMIGDLRDCNKKEFVRRLNVYRKRLYEYGLRIDGAVVRIV